MELWTSRVKKRLSWCLEELGGGSEEKEDGWESEEDLKEPDSGRRKRGKLSRSCQIQN